MNGKVQFLVFLLDDRRYGIRLSQVERVIRSVEFTPVIDAPTYVLGLIDYQGFIIPLLNLRSRLSLTDREIGVDDKFIIAKISERSVALAIDDIVNFEERSEDDLVAAAAILGDESTTEGIVQSAEGMILIHDLDRLFSLDQLGSFAAVPTTEMSHAS